MSSLQLKYEQSLAGAKATAAKDGAQVFDGLSEHGTVYSVAKGDYAILTGYAYYDGQWKNYLQTTSGVYILIDTYAGTEKDWVVTPGAETIPAHSVSQAQDLVNKIITNNQAILRNNLLCARYASRFSSAELQQIRDLQKRLQMRNSALQAGSLCDQIQTGYPAEYVELSAYLDRLMAGGVGVATWVVVVIAAAVVTATATAAYFTYKTLADESERDVKFSKELTATLVSKLTEEEYQQLLEETKGMLTKAKIKQLVRDHTGIAKTVLLAAGAYMIYNLIKDKMA